MIKYDLTDDDKNKLDPFPMEIAIDGLSRCCRKRRVLKQSKEGGFITANCVRCNRKNKISIDDFKTLDKKVGCPKCETVMEKGYVPGESNAKNYGFKCEKSEIYIWATEFIPWYDDRKPPPKILF